MAKRGGHGEMGVRARKRRHSFELGWARNVEAGPGPGQGEGSCGSRRGGRKPVTRTQAPGDLRPPWGHSGGSLYCSQWGVAVLFHCVGSLCCCANLRVLRGYLPAGHIRHATSSHSISHPFLPSTKQFGFYSLLSRNSIIIGFSEFNRFKVKAD